MKALRLHHMGGPEQVFIEDSPKPELRSGDALIRVHAAAITPDELTWEFAYRTPSGQDRLPATLSHEVAGIVEAVARDVKDVRVGMAVYGLTEFNRDGAAAEYVAVPAANLAPKPRSLDFVQAAAVPLSALTAWQALFDQARLQPAQRALVHGAAGGVGLYAIQMVKWRHAQPVGTASTRNLEILRRFGSEAIDYTRTRFEETLRDMDAVIDTQGGDIMRRSFQVLRRGGTLVSLVEEPPQDLARAAGVRAVFLTVHPSRHQLMEIGRLIDEGAIRPVIQEVLPLSDGRKAFEHVLRGHNQGKTVLKVAA